MQIASMNSATLRHATRGCVASATGDSSDVATCNGALAMQGGVAGQTSASLRVAGAAFAGLVKVQCSRENARAFGDLG